MKRVGQYNIEYAYIQVMVFETGNYKSHKKFTNVILALYF